jgi:phage tail-like protein
MSPILPSNPTRLDPYKNYEYRLLWNGATVAAFSTLSPLSPAAAPPVTLKSPVRTKYEPITLERGVTYDSGFQSWASPPPSPTPGPAPVHPLRDLTLELLNEAGEVATTYTIRNASVSEYQALPDLDAGANAIAIQHIKLENEGCSKA